jgi:hypothetical protein
MLRRMLSGPVFYALSGLLVAQAGQFLEAPQYPTGTNPQATAVGDFNRDGTLDLAVANSTSNTVSVLLGKGNGTFSPKVDYATGNTPQSVVIGDFNGDGYLDLAVTDSTSNTVSVFLGNGDGTFQPKVDYATGKGPRGAAAGDFNGDGYLDLVVTNATDGTIGVLLGKGNGTFNAEVTYNTGFNPFSVAVGDFNGDGILDLAVANNNNNNVLSVLLGNGNGTFQTQFQYATGNTPISIALADFNGDGNLDIAVADQQGNAVSILLGKGNGSFATHVDYSTADFPTAVTVGDFNGDGKPDVAVSAGDGNTISVLFGNGDGTFQGAVNWGTGNIPFSVVAGDFNNDGNTDLIVANSGGNSVSVLLNNGSGTFQSRTDYAAGPVPASLNTGPNPYAVATADFNGDGFLDVAVASSNCPVSAPTCGVSIVLGNGDGTFQVPSQYSTGSGTNPRSIAVGNFTGVNIPDLAVANYATDTVSILLGVGDGTFQAPVDYSVGSEPASVTTGDFIGNGNLDLVVANFNSDTVSVLLGNGNGTLKSAVNYNVGHGPISVAVGDFNGDGNLDLVVVNETDNNASVLLGNGDGTFQAQVAYPTGVGGNPLSVVVGDFNGDDNLDLAVADFQTQQVSVLLGNGDGTFQPVKAYATGANPSSIVIADFNGDGKLDLALTSTPLGSSQGNLVSLLLGNGDGTFASPKLFGTGSEAYSAAVGDFNGDGATDLAVANGISDTVSVLLNTQGTAMTVLSSGNPSAFGQSVTFTTTVAASVSNGTTAPTGSVTLKNGSTVIGSGTLVGGQFSLSAPALPVGEYSLSATYSGDSNYQSHTVGLTQTVQMAGTGTALVSSANPSNSNQSITFTATVTSNTTGGLTGKVTFLDGTGTIGASTVNGSGIATFSIATLSMGTHQITAAYGGNNNFNVSTSAMLSQVVQKASTSSVVSSSRNPSTVNQSVTFTAKLSWSAAGTPTGTVTFLDGTATIGTEPVSGNGVATFSISTLSGGTHNITGAYGGDSNFNASTSSVLSQTVQGNTSTTLTSSANPSTESQSATFTAAVSSGDGVFPTGTVKFMEGTTQLGSSAMNGSQIATLSIGTLSVGTHSITAVYSGDTDSDPSTSPAVSQVVQKANTATALSLAPTSANLHQTVTFAITVTTTAGGTPTGTVNFLDGTNQIGNSDLNGSGIATFSTSALTAGTHNITAAYGGDSNFNASNSTVINLVVTAPDFSLSATALSPSSVAPGASAKSTITITSSGGLNPSTVTLTCSVSPAMNPATTCSLGTISVANNTGTSTLTVATSGPQAAREQPAVEQEPGMLFALGLMIPAMLLGGAGLSMTSRRRLLSFCLIFLALGGCWFQAACGGGSTGPASVGNPSTPANTYTVTITGNASETLQQATSVSLTVQ